MDYLANFFAGGFLCNCIPHLVCGLKGEPFPSPFSKPPGLGYSSPPLNVLWGIANLIAGLWLLTSHPFEFGMNTACFVFFIGALLLGLSISWHFGKVHARNHADRA
jgi:hypothetical protein